MGRSVVNISLSKIETNSELMSLFFDQKYSVDGEPVPLRLGFNDVIFVLEDVDAGSEVVRRRDGKKTADLTLTERVDISPPKSLWLSLLQSSASDPSCKELVDLLLEKSDRLKIEAMSALSNLALRPIQAVPGLGMIGEGNGSAIVSKITSEAEESARKLMDSYSTVDRFLGIHAGIIKSVLDAGAEVDTAFEDILLGESTTESDPDAALFPGVSFQEGGPSREASQEYDVTYSQVAGQVQVETRKHSEALMNSLGEMLKSASDSSAKSNKKAAGKPKPAGIGASQFYVEDKDKLNLSGLLNVLDGVVDTPGRIVIMTTNHPERLDPALIRPGRIDKKLLLGYMRAVDIVSMIEHYFDTVLNERQKRRVERAIEGGDGLPAVRLTPAQVEQFACEFDDVDDLIGCIETVKGQGEQLHSSKYASAGAEIIVGS